MQKRPLGVHKTMNIGEYSAEHDMWYISTLTAKSQVFHTKPASQNIHYNIEKAI